MNEQGVNVEESEAWEGEVGMDSKRVLCEQWPLCWVGVCLLACF